MVLLLRKQQKFLVIFLGLFFLAPHVKLYFGLISTQTASASVLRFRRFEWVYNNDGQSCDLLAIGTNTIIKVDYDNGETLWKNMEIDETETHFVVGSLQDKSSTDIMNFYGNVVTGERINVSDGLHIDLVEEILNSSVWDLEIQLVDTDGTYPLEVALATSDSLSIYNSTLSGQLWNRTYENERKGSLYLLQNLEDYPRVGVWIEKNDDSQFQVYNAITGQSEWNLTLPNKGYWQILRVTSEDGINDKQILFFATHRLDDTDSNLYYVNNRNGSIIWDKKLGSLWYAAVHLNISPSGNRGFLLAGDDENGETLLAAINEKDATLIWNEKTAVTKLLAGEFTTDNISDYAFVHQRSLMIKNGSSHNPILKPIDFSSSIQDLEVNPIKRGTDSMIIVGLSDGTIHAINSSLGLSVWINKELAESQLIEIVQGSLGFSEIFFGLLFCTFIYFIRDKRKR